MFVVNRDMTNPTSVDLDLRAFPGAQVVEAVELSNPDHTWHASAVDSTSVGPRPLAGVTLDGGRLHAVLPPVSWAMIRLATRF